jgi:hypothetical protein
VGSNSRLQSLRVLVVPKYHIARIVTVAVEFGFGLEIGYTDIP